MPLTIYCQECGSPTNYTSSIPKFCSGCGKPYESAASVPRPQKTVASIRPVKKFQYTEEDDSQSTYIAPDIESLDVELGENRRRKSTIADVMKQSPSDEKRQIKKLSKQAAKQQLESLLAESKAKTERISIGKDESPDD